MALCVLRWMRRRSKGNSSWGSICWHTSFAAAAAAAPAAPAAAAAAVLLLLPLLDALSEELRRRYVRWTYVKVCINMRRMRFVEGWWSKLLSLRTLSTKRKNIKCNGGRRVGRKCLNRGVHWVALSYSVCRRIEPSWITSQNIFFSDVLYGIID